MDNTPIPLPFKNEDPLVADNLKSKEIVKNPDHSPTRSSVKDFKSTAIAKLDSKTPRKFAYNKYSAKGASKSQINLTRQEIQKAPTVAESRKSNPPVAAKSPSSLTLPGKSKIPAMKKSPLNSFKANSKIMASQKLQGLQEMSRKTVEQPNKKQQELKQRQITRFNSKTSISKSESLQQAKSSFLKSSSVPYQTKSIPKCQSARGSSESPNLGANKRSASSISTRSIPCPKMKEEFKTNLQKMISNSGDYNKFENTEIETPDILDDQNNPEEMPAVAEDVTDLKNSIRYHITDFFSSVKDEIRDTNETDEVDVKKIEEKLEQYQILKSNGIFSLIDDWCATKEKNTDLKVNKLKNDLEESYKSLINSEKKYDEFNQYHEQVLAELERELMEKKEFEVAKKEDDIKELRKDNKILEKQTNILRSNIQNLEKEKKILQANKDHLEEDHKNFRESIAATNKKLQDAEQQVKQDKKELKAKNDIIKSLETDLINKKQLETDLAEMTKKFQDLEAKVNSKAHNECVEHLKKISELTNKVKCLEAEKEVLHNQNEKFDEEIKDLTNLREKLQETEKKMRDLKAEYDAKEKAVEMVPDYSKEVQLELAKLRQSDAEKRREIEKLKTELSKAQFNICQMEQQVQRDQQLLEVRSGLINSLQTNEKTHRIHMEELFAQVGEKNNTINELNSELQTKSEEFRNLFTTLSAKQMEVANQEHIIKLLEESNERGQMLRVKQEEKIGRMEEELAHLKQTIAIYQANLLSGNSNKHLLFPPILPRSNVDYNENLYYYVSQRKRKRQVDINVKKYEA